MSLVAGDRVGSYEIIAPLGAGGMGEVYRARDSRLGREVAVKLLPDAFANDPERLARFEREARALAALNHPHIAQVYGFETVAPSRSGDPAPPALVMELVDGEDLAGRIARGPVAIDEAVAIARQVAEALEAAHEQGIVHRDLKPANVRIRPDGTVKLLDFGLAKALDSNVPGPGAPDSARDFALNNSPTLTSPAVTMRGVILGTAAYMAPEQARGKPVDKRADIWAFGVLLYEMLSGRRPFVGDDATGVLAQVLEREPDWDALPRNTPANLRRVMRRCLEKDRKRRLRDCGDVRLDLDETADLSGPAPARRPGWAAVVVGAAGVALGALATVLTGVARAPEAAASAGTPARFAVIGAAEESPSGGRPSFVLSADGRRLVYVANRRLMARDFRELNARPIAGTEPVPAPAGLRGNTGVASQPILSPDGETVAFFQDGQLKRVPVAGGVPSVICSCPDALGATWGPDNTIVYATGRPSGRAGAIWRVAANGGTPQLLIAGESEQTMLRPQMLPDGDHVLFTVTTGVLWEEADVVAESLATKERHVLVEGAIDGRFAPGGYLVYARDGVLQAVRFDPATLKVSGTPARLVADVAQDTSAGAWGGFNYSLSAEGTMVYRPTAAAAIRRVLVWMDRGGREEALPTEPRAYQYPRFSPDGQRVALDLRDQQNDVWSWDLGRATLTRLTVGRRAGGPATWDREGTSVLFGPDVKGIINLYAQPVSGGAARRLTTSPNTQFVDDVTPDGEWLVFEELDPKAAFDLWRVRLDGAGEPTALIRTPFDERNADISPDGRWIAYQSDESGRFEVYVRPYPDVDGGRWMVSTSGGTRPLWGRDGRELFFLDTNRRMTSVSVSTSSPLSFGRPVTLFEAASLGLEGQQRNFDLSPDGKRFLMVRNLPPPSDVPGLILVQHWLADVRAELH